MVIIFQSHNMAQAQPLIINEWAEGIGDSPNTGTALIQNCSIDSVPGGLMPNYAPLFSTQQTSQSKTGTFNAAITAFVMSGANTQLSMAGTAVTLSTSGSLPSGLSANTIYWVIRVSGSTQINFAATLSDAVNVIPISWSGTGSGTITVSTVDMGTPNSIAAIKAQNVIFIADSNGRIWGTVVSNNFFNLIGGNTVTNGIGKGLVIFETSNSSHYYLFVYRNAVVDVAEVTTNAEQLNPSWSSAWQTLNSSAGSNAQHQAVLGYDDIIYSCDGRYINSIQEVPGKVFSPSDSTTYIWNAKALTLPPLDIANYLEQLGQLLLIGGGLTNIIYPWDRISPSFNLPILCPETGIYGMKNIGNQIFILNGTRGNIYSTLGYFVTFVKKLPEYITQSTTGQPNTITWGGISAKNGALLFGVGTNAGPNSGAYLLYPDSRLTLERIPSKGSLNVTVFSMDTGEFYFMGYPGGIDYTDTNRINSLGSAIFQSKLYTVGTKVGKATFSLLEVQLDRPGITNQQTRISYRTDVESGWTALATYTADGSNTSFDSDIGLTDIQNIQVQVEVSGAGNGANAMVVREVRLLQGTH